MESYKPEIKVIVRPEWIEVRGNAMASGDDAFDKKVEDEIIERFNGGDIWAWCTVEVQAEFKGITASDHLGGCSYNDEKDFMAGGYYEDMVKTAVGELADKIAELQGCEINRDTKAPAWERCAFEYKE